MNAALRTKLLAVLLLAGIIGGTVATVAATTAPAQGTTYSALAGGLYPGFTDAMENHLGGTVLDLYDQGTVLHHAEGLCVDAERGATDAQIITAASQSLGRMGLETARRMYAIVLAYGICSLP